MGQQATPGGLSLERLIAAGLETLEADGLDGLSMRAVADRLGVKAASLYWHVRDRRALLALITTAVLSTVELPVAGTPWRVSVPAVCASLDATLEARRDFAALLIETRGALEASPVVGRLLEDLAAPVSHPRRRAAPPRCSSRASSSPGCGTMPPRATGRSSSATPRCSSTRPRSG